MEEKSLIHIQRLAEQLSPYEQARLLAFLANRVSLMVAETASSASHGPSEPVAAWEEFFRLGDVIDAMATPSSDSLTSAVLTMRR